MLVAPDGMTGKRTWARFAGTGGPSESAESRRALGGRGLKLQNLRNGNMVTIGIIASQYRSRSAVLGRTRLISSRRPT